jgi:hypothetical protein
MVPQHGVITCGLAGGETTPPASELNFVFCNRHWVFL